MKCIACGNEAGGSSCPCCRFPVYEIVGDSVDESKAQIEAFAKIHRDNYLNDVSLGIVAYEWKDDNGKIVEKSHTRVFFADGRALKTDEVWLQEDFARLPDADKLTVKVVIKKGTAVAEQDVQIQNLTEREFQKIGFRLEEELHVRMLLKNDSSRTESAPISVAIG